MLTHLYRRVMRCHDGETGQAYLEFVLLLSLAIFLAGVFGSLAWYWWNQTVAAVAIHDGTRAAAVWHGGSLHNGYATTDRILQAGLGGTAPDQQHYSIGYAGDLRSVIGSIDYQYSAPFGLGLLRIRSRAFLRDEQFYPGPPERWE
ncbi:MAG: hypothetical protein KKA73_09290 [Chloroflexi bacterium]|nr:hypothetical protein [Chloroflexota bacterium]MBU1747872.1 hypothetical protein [Chloroflexota bacterium]